MHLKLYKVGQSWVVSCRLPSDMGLIHWSHWSLWRVLRTFPLALYWHLRFYYKRS